MCATSARMARNASERHRGRGESRKSPLRLGDVDSSVLTPFVIGTGFFLWALRLSLGIKPALFIGVMTTSWFALAIIGAYVHNSSINSPQFRYLSINGEVIRLNGARNIERSKGLDHVGSVIGYLLRSTFKDGSVKFGLPSEALQYSLNAIRDLVLTWNFQSDLVHPEDHGNKSFNLALTHELWDLLLQSNDLDANPRRAAIEVLDRIYTDIRSDVENSATVTVSRMWGPKCVDWFRQSGRLESETIRTVIRAVLYGSMLGDRSITLGGPLGHLLQSTMGHHGVTFGESDRGLRTLMPVLKDIISNWNSLNDLVYPEDPCNKSFLHTLHTRLWTMLQEPGWVDDESNTATLTVLEMLGPLVDEDGGLPVTKNLNELLMSDSLSPRHKLRCLRILDRQLRSMKMVPMDYIHCHQAVRDVLISTMWGSGGMPEYRYADVRAAWILDDFDEFYPRLLHTCYSQDLYEWRRSIPQPRPGSEESLAATKLYLQTMLRLLTRDQKLWASRFDEDGHLCHLQDIIQDKASWSLHILCTICFILIFEVVQTQHPDDCCNINETYITKPWVNMIAEALITSLDTIQSFMVQPMATRVIGVLWRFLFTAASHGKIEKAPMSRVHHKIAAYLIHGSNVELDEDSEACMARDLTDTLVFKRSLRSSTDRASALKLVERSDFILSTPNIDLGFRLLGTSLLNKALSAFSLRQVSDWEVYLRSLGRVLDDQSGSSLEVLEKESHIDQISRLIGATTWSDGTTQRLREAQWWCLRLFLAMWHRRHHINPTSYTSRRQFIVSFFSSMDHWEDVFESQRALDEVPQSHLAALEFMEAACTYLEFIKLKMRTVIPADAVRGYKETCRHYLVSGASRWKEYANDTNGEEYWMQDITPLITRVQALST
ncbi:hypothetical protein FRC02_007892 [Tulasnella sp. 418]|nr:hypothetical protein FRC02_007892 [Tulasnella sp. 418]